MKHTFRNLMFGTALSVAFLGVAHAVPISFTWNPAGTTGPAAPVVGTPFTANSITVTDYARIVLNTPGPAGSFQEQGDLAFSAFTNNGQQVFPVGYGSNYSLYASFNAAGTQPSLPSAPGTSTTGNFTSLDYVFYAQNGAFPTFSATTAGVTVAPSTNRSVVAYGSLVSGTATATEDQSGAITPSALVTLSFNPCTSTAQGNTAGTCSGDESAFFVAPPPSAFQLVFGQFSANSQQAQLVTVGNQPYFVINQGGGSLSFASVPEPMSLSLLGSGLIGLAALRRVCRKA